MKPIDPYKMHCEYSEEELKALPAMNPKWERDADSFMWNGEEWEYVPMD